MRTWKVYKRGNTYRVAKPGWLFWHWAKKWDIGGSIPVTTPFFAEAQNLASKLNLDDALAEGFRKDRWHEAE